MTKIFAIALFAVLSVGCASKGDLAALTTRVDSLEAAHKVHEADHEAIKAEVSDLSNKVDRAFAKGKK